MALTTFSSSSTSWERSASSRARPWWACSSSLRCGASGRAGSTGCCVSRRSAPRSSGRVRCSRWASGARSPRARGEARGGGRRAEPGAALARSRAPAAVGELREWPAPPRHRSPHGLAAGSGSPALTSGQWYGKLTSVDTASGVSCSRLRADSCRATGSPRQRVRVVTEDSRLRSRRHGADRRPRSRRRSCASQRATRSFARYSLDGADEEQARYAYPEDR